MQRRLARERIPLERLLAFEEDQFLAPRVHEDVPVLQADAAVADGGGVLRAGCVEGGKVDFVFNGVAVAGTKVPLLFWRGGILGHDC